MMHSNMMRLRLHSLRRPAGCQYGSEVDVLGKRMQVGSMLFLVLAWMLWEAERRRGGWHGCSPNNVMRGGANDFEGSEAPKVLFVPRRTV